MGPSASSSYPPRISRTAETSSTIHHSSSSPLKRKRTDEYEDTVLNPELLFRDEPLTISPSLTLSMIEAAFEHDVVDASFPQPENASPPSPVPTEIVEVYESTQEEHMASAIALGIKVRDFAYDAAPSSRRAPEMWLNPVHTLTLHDMYIRSNGARAEVFKLPGKTLWRLLRIGWVTEEEAKRHWTEADWEAVKQYEAESAYPFIYPKRIKKPSKSYRAALRIQTYGEPRADDIPEEQIYVPEDEPDVDHGPSASEFSLPEGESDSNIHQQKKRRVDEEEASASIVTPPTTPPATPPPVQHDVIKQVSQSVATSSATSPLPEDPTSACLITQRTPEPSLSRAATLLPAQEQGSFPSPSIRARSQTLPMVR